MCRARGPAGAGEAGGEAAKEMRLSGSQEPDREGPGEPRKVSALRPIAAESWKNFGQRGDTSEMGEVWREKQSTE